MKTIILTSLLLCINLFADSNNNGALFQNETPKDSTYFNIDPTDSNGIFNSKVTKADLLELFGEENVIEKAEWIEEGTIEIKTTVVYPESENELKVYWNKNDSLKMISISLPNSKWVINGLSVGMPLDDVVKTNSANVSFYGFGWDNGGEIYNWNEGKLAPYSKNVKVILNLDWEKVGNQNIDKFMGDNTKLKSNNTELKKLGLSVYSILVNY